MPLTAQVRGRRAKICSLDLATWTALMTSFGGKKDAEGRMESLND